MQEVDMEATTLRAEDLRHGDDALDAGQPGDEDAVQLGQEEHEEEDPDATQEFDIEGHERAVRHETERLRTQRILDEANKIFGPLRSPSQYGPAQRNARSPTPVGSLMQAARMQKERNAQEAARRGSQQAEGGQAENPRGAAPPQQERGEEDAGTQAAWNREARAHAEAEKMLDDLEVYAGELRHDDADKERGENQHLNADTHEEHPATPTKKAKLAQETSPQKTKGQVRKGITDMEIEGTEEAKLPRAGLPAHNPFLVDATSAGRTTSGPSNSAGATAQGPPTTFGPRHTTSSTHDAGQARTRAEQAHARPQQVHERVRPQDITTMAQLAAMIQNENDTDKEAVGRRMDRMEEVQLQANRRIKKVENDMIKIETRANDAHILAKKNQNETQKLAENSTKHEGRTAELERRMNEVEKLAKEGVVTTSSGTADDLPRNQRRVIVVAGFLPESRRADIVEAVTQYLSDKGIKFSEVYTNFRRTTICKVRFASPYEAHFFSGSATAATPSR